MTTDTSSAKLGGERGLRSGIAGLVAGGLALGSGQLVAALVDVATPVDAVGGRVIDAAPRAVKLWAIDVFGTNDKRVLRLGIVAVLAVIAFVVGIIGRRRLPVAAAGFAAFGVLGAVASSTRGSADAGLAAVPSLFGAGLGAGALAWLVGTGGGRKGPHDDTALAASMSGVDASRRSVLALAGVGAVGVVSGRLASVVSDTRVRRARDEARLRSPSASTSPAGASAVTTPTAPQGAQLVPSTPYLTPNPEFFRIDTALAFPTIDVGTWRLSIGGMVERPFDITYDELVAMPQEEHIVTLCCVSNEVGGDLVANAVWTGVPLRALLERAGVAAGAEQLFTTSVDGWTSGFPIGVATDGRATLVALTMNGEALPLEHGYPARLVVPGLYGYVSATKWIRRIEAATWDREGYWVPRGWARLGPVKTQSRIDVPRRGSTIRPGAQPIAGVAWAQHVGVMKVEVRVDDGPWQAARLARDVSDDSWRQWVLPWDAPSGEHTITVRATDKTGAVQPEHRTDVAPDGATGWHAISITVE